MKDVWVHNSGKNRIRKTCFDGWEHYNFTNDRWICGKDRKIKLSDIKRGITYDSTDVILKKYYKEVIKKSLESTGGNNG